MRSIKIHPHAPIDEKWHAGLCEATEGITETFVMLMPGQEHLQRERQKFFDSGCSLNPDLLPQHIDVAYIRTVTGRLTVLHDEIAAEEPNRYIREAYCRHIEDYITNLRMLSAVMEKDHVAFMENNVALYGEPDKDVFAAICAWIRQDAEQTQSPDQILSRLKDEVLRAVPDIGGDPAMLMPDEDVFHLVRNMHLQEGGYFDQLFAPHGIPAEPYIGQESGDSIARQAIANVGSDYTIESAQDGLWAVLSRSRQVIRPAGYRVDRDYFTGVIAHEIGSHLLEEANGARQPLRLLGLGLNGFEKGNEGRAYLREQIVYPDASVFTRQSSWEYILILHLAVSLAYGTYNKPYTFSELYELLYALHRFWRQRRYPLDTINEAEAAEESWLLAVRVMKGTDGNTIRGCYMKDTVYLQGNIACWRMARVDPELLLLGDIGKFNVTDDRHWVILNELGIVPPTVAG